MYPGDFTGLQNLARQADTVITDPPWPHRLLGEVLGTGQIPGALTEIPLGRFWTVREEEGSLLTEKWSGRGLHSFLAHLTPVVYPVPGLE